MFNLILTSCKASIAIKLISEIIYFLVSFGLKEDEEALDTSHLTKQTFMSEASQAKAI